MIKEHEDIIEDYKWEVSRKEFLRSLLVLGVAVNIPFLTSCESNEALEGFDCAPLSIEQLKVLQSLQLILFPAEGNGPSAIEVNADKWVVYVLNDSRDPQREKEFIIKHLDGLSEFSIATYDKPYDSLTVDNQEELLELFFEDKTQKKWGSRMLTLIFEALLLDPIYGVNPDNIGWKWLSHNPGTPRPNEKNKYPTIYTTMNEV